MKAILFLVAATPRGSHAVLRAALPDGAAAGESGVRFVQIFIAGQIWDTHSDLDKSLRYCCGKTDKPAAALIRDLKQRGLLDSALILWGGEFGRMPISQIRAGDSGARSWFRWLYHLDGRRRREWRHQPRCDR